MPIKANSAAIFKTLSISQYSRLENSIYVLRNKFDSSWKENESLCMLQCELPIYLSMISLTTLINKWGRTK